MNSIWILGFLGSLQNEQLYIRLYHRIMNIHLNYCCNNTMKNAKSLFHMIIWAEYTSVANQQYRPKACKIWQLDVPHNSHITRTVAFWKSNISSIFCRCPNYTILKIIGSWYINMAFMRYGLILPTLFFPSWTNADFWEHIQISGSTSRTSHYGNKENWQFYDDWQHDFRDTNLSWKSVDIIEHLL